MKNKKVERELMVENLDLAVDRAISFFRGMDAHFFDGFQTAHEVLSHIVFWHREVVQISYALLLNTKPQLRKASLAKLNALAEEEFCDMSMKELSVYLQDLQESLAENLGSLPDWGINFPYKKGCRQANVAQRVAALAKHINAHINRQERIQRRGKAWVEAYYQE